MFSPGIVDLFCLTSSFHISQYGIQLGKCIFPVLKLASFSSGGHCDTGWNMSKPYTGFNFVYILTTVAATMEAFEPDVVVFAYIRYFRNDADINVPVFRLW